MDLQSKKIYLAIVFDHTSHDLRVFLDDKKKNPMLLRFGLTADSHYANRPHRGTRFYNESHLKMREFVEIMNQKKVDFIMHLGDMKDEDENKKEQDTLNYLKIIESEFSNFNGPTYHCVGNHDVDSITKSQFLNGIENTNIPKTNSYYSFDFNQFHCIVLDANYTEDGIDHFYKSPINFQNTNIPNKEIDWLEKDLLENTNKMVLVFCHHPLFEYFRKGYQFHINNYQEIQKLFLSHGNVIAVFQGHVHQERFQLIKGTHYITQLGMVDYSGLDNNCFALVEINHQSIEIFGYKRSSNQSLVI